MKSIYNPGRLTPLALAMLCAACGGGGSGNDNVAGIDGSGSPAYASGPITGFGSILLNGKRYIVTNDTSITVDGSDTAQSVLQVGQYVAIASSGTDDNGNPIATQVRSETILEGPVTAIDAGNNQISVLNQTIVIDGRTVFDEDIPGRALAGLAVNDIVEITGAFNNNGKVLATRIELDDDNDEAKLVGNISNLNVDNSEFTINGQLVRYGGALLEDIPGGSLSNDDVVKVEGSVNNDTLEASKVEGFDDLYGNVGDDDEVEIKGSISRFGSITDFDVNGVTVVTNAQTSYEDGTSAQLGIDVVVQVEGSWSNGKLIAEEVDFEVEDTIKIDGTLQAVTATDASRNEGSVTLFGISLVTERSTFFDDDSNLEVSDFGLDDLRVGDYVEIEGYVAESGAYIVTELQRDDSDASAIIQGPLTTTNLPNSVTVLGQLIDTSAINTAILNGVQPGTIVKLNGNIVGGNFVATQIELQIGDD